MDVRQQLPEHSTPAVASSPLCVEGLVASPGPLAPASLAALPRHLLQEPFTCEEGWTVPGLRWRGVRLLDVVALAQPLSNAQFVRICSGDFAFPLALADAASALLCDELDDRPLTPSHGAPWRLVLPGGQCFSSVKWVDRLELAQAPGPNTAERIARQRLPSGR